MKTLVRWVRNFFGFSRTETNGFLVLLPLIMLAVFSQPAWHWWESEHTQPAPDDSKDLDSIVTRWTRQKSDDAITTLRTVPTALPLNPRSVSLFKFNPNTLPPAGLVRLGLSEQIAQRIVRYREKGGKFKIRSDLGKIYGIDSAALAKLAEFIDLPVSPLAQTSRGDGVGVSRRIRQYDLPREKFAGGKLTVTRLPAFDLNLADTTELITINGIGPKLSKRIIAYRNRLGGFISPGQLSEVYGLDSTVIARLLARSFIAPDFVPPQIDLNLATKKQLLVLPYVRYPLANAIAVWRLQHGDFKSVNELRQIALIDSLTFQRIKPYLTVKERR